MDTTMFALLLAILKGMPGTAVSESAANADRAEAAAAVATSAAYTLTVTDEAFVFTAPTQE